jgi:hypothetical protein
MRIRLGHLQGACVLGSLVSVVLFGCGESSGPSGNQGGSTEKSTAGIPESEKLLSAQDIWEVLGKRANLQSQPPRDTVLRSCTYSIDEKPFLIVQVQSNGKVRFDSTRQMMARRPIKDVAGLGDAAFMETDDSGKTRAFFVLKGEHLIVLSSFEHGYPTDDDLMKLARKVLGLL